MTAKHDEELVATIPLDSIFYFIIVRSRVELNTISLIKVGLVKKIIPFLSLSESHIAHRDVTALEKRKERPRPRPRPEQAKVARKGKEMRGNIP